MAGLPTDSLTGAWHVNHTSFDVTFRGNVIDTLKSWRHNSCQSEQNCVRGWHSVAFFLIISLILNEFDQCGCLKMRHIKETTLFLCFWSMITLPANLLGLDEMADHGSNVNSPTITEWLALRSEKRWEKKYFVYLFRHVCLLSLRSSKQPMSF